jgi:gas vesicle protein
VARDSDAEDGGGFGWGLVLGGMLGFIAGAYLASGPGREQVDSLRAKTIELTGRSEELKQRARTAASRATGAMSDPSHPVGRAIQDGFTAARRRRAELEQEARTTDITPVPPEAPAEGL